MRSIVRHPRQSIAETSLDERMERLAATTPGQRRHALVFLSGYAPDLFGIVLDAVASCPDDEPEVMGDAEPCCAFCAERVGIFTSAGPYWLHYRGQDQAGPFQVFEPGHDPVITWRPSADLVPAS
jgi:hypothetical protein